MASRCATWFNRFGVRIYATLAVVIFLSQGELASGGVRLALDGKAECSIVQPAGALELEALAVKELADHLEKVIGQRPPIIDAPGEGVNILIGRSPEIERLVHDVNFDELGTEGIVMRTAGKNLVLTGGRPRGVLFAVYTFLQDVVGVRWWAPDVTHIPSKPTLIVSDLKVVDQPAFEMRHFRTGPLWDKTFALRMRHNGWLMNFEPGDHTIGKLVPAEEHFEAHPDWFMYLADDGLGSDRYSFENGLKYIKETRPESWYRIAEAQRRLPWQICPSSSGVLDATTKAVRELLAAKYEKWQYPPKVVWVSQIDGRWECKCDACLAIKQEQGTPSAVWVRFVNAIAKHIEKDYPDVLIATMAFAHTEKPPANLRARDNVLIYSIPVSSNRKVPLTDIVHGQYVAKWCDIAKHVYIWEHETNFRNWVQPHPNHFVGPANLRFFDDHGIKGMMIQGGHGNASDFQRMRAYVTCQLMWNPRQDEKAMMNEFLRGYYGEAGPYLMKWLLVQHHAVHRDKGIVLGAYSTSTKNWLTLEDLNAGTRLFDQALQAVAGDETLEYRVRRTKLSIDIVWLERYDELRAAAAERGQPFLGPSDPMAEFERIASNEIDVQWYRGHGGAGADFSEYVEKLRKLLASHAGAQ